MLAVDKGCCGGCGEGIELAVGLLGCGEATSSALNGNGEVGGNVVVTLGGDVLLFNRLVNSIGSSAPLVPNSPPRFRARGRPLADIGGAAGAVVESVAGGTGETTISAGGRGIGESTASASN